MCAKFCYPFDTMYRIEQHLSAWNWFRSLNHYDTDLVYTIIKIQHAINTDPFLNIPITRSVIDYAYGFKIG